MLAGILESVLSLTRTCPKSGCKNATIWMKLLKRNSMKHETG
jgi:hypothetical protein